MKWEVPCHTAGEIKRAGEKNGSGIFDMEDLSIADNWRAAHAYPLYQIGAWLHETFPDRIVAQRLKRMDSIADKLQRSKDMSLWRMQDLGGCRVLMDGASDVYAGVDKLKRCDTGHLLKREMDYMQNPRSWGYRGYHMIYAYQGERTFSRNMLIEVQLRTYLQHLWATAVEIAAFLRGERLKAGQGDRDVLRFFAIISSLFAYEEGLPPAPGMENNAAALLDEARSIDFEKDILGGLNAIRKMVRVVENDEDGGGKYYALALNKEKYTLALIPFDIKDIAHATRVYEELEARREFDAVLIHSSRFSEICKAYPNYFADAGAFIEKAEEVLYNKRR